MKRKLLRAATLLMLSASVATGTCGCGIENVFSKASSSSANSSGIPEKYKEEKNIAKNKGTLAHFTHMNWGLVADNYWAETEYIIGYDKTLTRRETNVSEGLSFTDSNTETMSDEDYNSLLTLVKELGEDDVSHDACDGDAWTCVVFDEVGNCVGYMPSGYIYGKKPMEEKIVPILSKYAQITEYTEISDVLKYKIDKDNHERMMSFNYVMNDNTYKSGEVYFDGTLLLDKGYGTDRITKYELSDGEFDSFQYYIYYFSQTTQCRQEDAATRIEMSVYDPALGKDAEYICDAEDAYYLKEFSFLLSDISEKAKKTDSHATPGVAAGNASNDSSEVKNENSDSKDNEKAESILEKLSSLGKAYYNRLEDAVDDEILYFVSDDFDIDGIEEAFAIVGSDENSWDEGAIEGHVYFVDVDEVTNLTENIPLSWGPLPELIPSEDSEFSVIKTGDVVSAECPMFFAPAYRSAATAVDNFVFGVKDGKAYEANISRQGAVIGQRDGQVMLTVDCYDGYSDNSGHTWKPYYLHYNKDSGMFDQYLGVEISEEKLLSYAGAQEVFDSIRADKNTITNILERGNGIININYYDGDPNNTEYPYGLHNVTLKVTGNTVVILKATYSMEDTTADYKESDYGGTYEEGHPRV